MAKKMAQALTLIFPKLKKTMLEETTSFLNIEREASCKRAKLLDRLRMMSSATRLTSSKNRLIVIFYPAKSEIELGTEVTTSMSKRTLDQALLLSMCL